MEVNADMIVQVLSLPVSLPLFLLRTHCQAAAHLFGHEEDVPGASLTCVNLVNSML